MGNGKPHHGLNRNQRRYRTAKEIVIPKGSSVVYVNKMNHVVTETALVMIVLEGDYSFDWMMQFQDAFASGLIEEIGADVRP